MGIINFHPLVSNEDFFIDPMKKIDSLISAPLLSAASNTCDHQLFTPHHHDVIEDKDTFRVSIDVPGVKERDISITFEDSAVKVEGVRRSVTSDGKTLKKAKFSKVFGVDSQTVDVEKLQANLADGVLVISAPRITKPKGRKIMITSKPHVETVVGDDKNNHESDTKAISDRSTTAARHDDPKE